MIDDWSKLIIVNYEGGRGGDFLCELLHKGLNDPSHDICLNDKNNLNVLLLRNILFTLNIES